MSDTTKKTPAWVWVLVIFAVMSLTAIGGCGLLLFAAGSAVDDAADEQEKKQEEIQADFKGCEVVEDDGDYNADITVTNQSSETSAYTVDLILSVGGQRVTDFTVYLNNVRAGETVTERARTFRLASEEEVERVRVSPGDALLCEVLDVTRRAEL